MTEKHTILVVDDEPANIDVLKGILSADYRIKAATNGKRALEIILSDEPPSLVLLDVMMPEMSGHDVLVQVHESAERRDVPVIFVTAMTEVGDEARGLSLGAVDYITKPVSPPLVKARVETQLRILESRRRQEALARKLSRYLSPSIWKSLFEGRQEAQIGAQRRKLTVFFSDIVSFASRTEHLEPEVLTHLLNEYLERMTTIALAHGGTVDKFIGDAVMVFFGDPETRGEREDAEACARMAFEMREATEALAPAWAGSAGKPFASRMGIATGFCTVGNFGSSERMDYTIIGNTVNLASRLEGIAEPGQILVSGETWALLEDSFSGVAQGQVAVKGFERPQAAYSLESNVGGRIVAGSGQGYRLRVDLKSLDEAGRAELRDVLSKTLEALEED